MIDHIYSNLGENDTVCSDTLESDLSGHKPGYLTVK